MAAIEIRAYRPGFLAWNAPYFPVVTNPERDILGYRDDFRFALGDSDLV